METNFFKMEEGRLRDMCIQNGFQIEGLSKMEMAEQLDNLLNLNGNMVFSWRKPWLYTPMLDDINWTVGEKALPFALHQGNDQDTCLAYAMRGMMMGQMQFLARKYNLPTRPSRLCIDDFLEKCKRIGFREDNVVELIRMVQNEGVVAEEHFDQRHDPNVPRYYLSKDELAGECSIYANGKEDFERVKADVQECLRTVGPLLCSLRLYDNYKKQRTLYRPCGRRIRNPDTDGEMSHVVCLTGWGTSTVRGERRTNVWEYLNSYGPDFGRSGGYGEVVMTGVVEVFTVQVKKWWRSDE